MTGPRALRDPSECARRRALLAEAHMAPLAGFTEALRGPGVEVPDFDPLDGGVRARLLFLLEKPGPATSPSRRGRPGSGFVSRDSDDPTAEATWTFMREAGIDRRETVIWNVVPRWNGTTRIGAGEVEEGLGRLDALLDLLPRLVCGVTVGRRAERAAPRLASRGLRLVASAHPSPQVRAAYPDRWTAIPRQWRAAGDLLV